MEELSAITVRCKIFRKIFAETNQTDVLCCFVLHYRSKLWDHVFFDDYLNYLNFNSVSDEICSLNELNAIKTLYKMSLE